jgi:hypothetical protein
LRELLETNEANRFARRRRRRRWKAEQLSFVSLGVDPGNKIALADSRNSGEDSPQNNLGLLGRPLFLGDRHNLDTSAQRAKTSWSGLAALKQPLSRGLLETLHTGRRRSRFALTRLRAVIFDVNQFEGAKPLKSWRTSPKVKERPLISLCELLFPQGENYFGTTRDSEQRRARMDAGADR